MGFVIAKGRFGGFPRLYRLGERGERPQSLGLAILADASAPAPGRLVPIHPSRAALVPLRQLRVAVAGLMIDVAKVDDAIVAVIAVAVVDPIGWPCAIM